MFATLQGYKSFDEFAHCFLGIHLESSECCKHYALDGLISSYKPYFGKLHHNQSKKSYIFSDHGKLLFNQAVLRHLKIQTYDTPKIFWHLLKLQLSPPPKSAGIELLPCTVSLSACV